MSDLKNEIHDYWTNRARGYSEYNQQEIMQLVSGSANCVIQHRNSY